MWDVIRIVAVIVGGCLVLLAIGVAVYAITEFRRAGKRD